MSKQINLRLDDELLAKVDVARKGFTRTAWIQEMLREQIEREDPTKIERLDDKVTDHDRRLRMLEATAMGVSL